MRLQVLSRPNLAAITLVATALMLVIPSARAAEPFEGKRITFVLGGTPGAGLDTYVRVVARHFGRYVPGSAGTLVQNMPGAGSYKTAEFMATLAPKDGTTIGSVFPGAIMAPLLDETKPRFDPREFQYIGTAETGARICGMFHTSKVKSYEDALTVPAVVAASQAGGSSRDYTLMANALANTKLKMVSGYVGGSDMFLAVERGEAEGLCGFDWSTIKTVKGDWLREAKFKIIMQFAVTADPELTRLGVPDFLRHVPATERPVAELIVAQQVFSRMFCAAPGTSAERVGVLREAFLKTMADKDFLVDAGKAQLNIEPMDGAQVAAVVARIYGAAPDVVARARKALQPP